MAGSGDRKGEKNESKKTCFVICPIGSERSDIRRRSDLILEYIIRPAVEGCGYEIPKRSDQESRPGIITSQVIERLKKDDLVIADLSDFNPNVFYELAIRHAVRKPVVQFMFGREPVPFDISPMRLIRYDELDLSTAALTREGIVEQIHAFEAGQEVESPITVAIAFPRRGGTDQERSNGMIIGMLQELLYGMRSSQRVEQISPSGYSPGFGSGYSGYSGSASPSPSTSPSPSPNADYYAHRINSSPTSGARFDVGEGPIAPGPRIPK